METLLKKLKLCIENRQKILFRNLEIDIVDSDNKILHSEKSEIHITEMDNGKISAKYIFKGGTGTQPIVYNTLADFYKDFECWTKSMI